jgi:hypothetical protein
MIGAEDFSGATCEFLGSGSVRMFSPVPLDVSRSGIMDRNGQWVEPPGTREFDRDDPSVRLVLKDKLWGVARADRSWLVEAKQARTGLVTSGLLLHDTGR